MNQENEYYSVIDFFADDKDLIIYRPILRQICDSVTASILFSQLIYWLKKYPDGFFKTIQNDSENSWCNELGFSYAEFVNAFDKIGVRYKSKKEYNNAENKFNKIVIEKDENKNEIKTEKEFMFCCYSNRLEYRTHFHWNLKLIQNNLCNLRKSNYSNSTKSNYKELNKVELQVNEESQITSNSTKLNQNNNRLIKETNKKTKRIKESKKDSLPDSRVKEFQEAWIKEYPPSPNKYIVTNWGKWGKQIKTLIKSFDDRYNSKGFEKLNECRKRYFKSNDKWYVEKGFSFDIFMSSINSFLNKKKVKSGFERNLEELGIDPKNIRMDI